MPDHPLPAATLLDSIRAVVGDRGILTETSDTAPYSEDWRHLYQGRTSAVVRPNTTEELAAVVKLCAASGTPIVPQGGNTSMVGGAVPNEDGSELILSTARLNRIRDLDPADMTLTIESGVTLKAAQMAAAEQGCLLPLSISSEGTAQIGGVLAVNAGGNNTVRYGNARDLVLGLEVVLPDGTIWNGLRRLRKDNTGYCLRQLFVGSEGTLGIITAAVLKLVPQPKEIAVALCGVDSPEAALSLFTRFQAHDAASISAFELMSGLGMSFVLKHIPGTTLPLESPAPFYALVELASPRPNAGLRAMLEEILEKALEDGIVQDAAIAESDAQRAAIWRLREEHSEGQKREGASVKNDVSVPVSKVPAFIRKATAACEALLPGVRVVPFGHMGDGNIHFNLEQPVGSDAAWFLAQDHAIMDAVNEIVREYDGSFSAEHGIGKLKPYMMPDWRGGAELALMQRIKAAIDPGGIMNPGEGTSGPRVGEYDQLTDSHSRSMGASGEKTSRASTGKSGPAPRPRESDLYAPVKQHLETAGYVVRGEVGRCDIVGVAADTVVAVELKLSFGLPVLYQALQRLPSVDLVYVAVAVPEGRTARRNWDGQVTDAVRLCRMLGVGLLSVRNDTVIVHADPGPYQPRKQTKQRAKLLSEFVRRSGDHNLGGTTRRPRVTAYREDALACASVLALQGPMKGAAVRDAIDVQKAAIILRDNVYGWFTKVARGIYDVAPAGRTALGVYADVTASRVVGTSAAP